MTETAQRRGAGRRTPPCPDHWRSPDDDGQLWALHRAIEAAVALPLDVHVVGEPLALVGIEYDGNARRGLVARCCREDGSEHRIGLADVEMPARTPAARHVAAYRAWVGIPEGGAPATTPRSRRQHKAGDDDLDLSRPVELVVLAVKERAARCRLLGSGRVITLRAGSLYGVVAGQIVTVAPNKHWRHAGHPYLSGQIAGTRIDASALGLVPLALRAANAREAGVDDRSSPGGRPRSAFELEVPQIPTKLAAANIDDPDAVAEKLLEADLRFLDAHAYLAGRLLGMSPQWAVQQYKVGVGIGQLSVGDDFDGVLPGRARRKSGTHALPVGLWLVSMAARTPRRGRARVREGATARSGRPPRRASADVRYVRRSAVARHGALVTPDTRAIDRTTQVLASANAPETFATRRTVSADELRLDGADIGPIPLPLSPGNPRRLCGIARPARYGLRDQALLDRKVRDIWAIAR